MDSAKPLKVSCGICHQNFVSSSFHFSKLHDEAVVDRTCQSSTESDWDLESFEAKAKLYHIPQTIAKECEQCGRAHYPADRGHFLGRTLPTASHSIHLLVIFSQCIFEPSHSLVNGADKHYHPHDGKEMELIGPGNLLPLLQGSVPVLAGPLTFKDGQVWKAMEILSKTYNKLIISCQSPTHSKIQPTSLFYTVAPSGITPDTKQLSSQTKQPWWGCKQSSGFPLVPKKLLG